MYKHILIDGRNALYRAMYAGLSDKKFVESKHDISVIYFRLISSCINYFKTSNIHMFWDAPKSTVWRKSIYQEYKEGREPHAKHKEVDVNAILNRNTEIIISLSKYVNCRSYLRETQEADDLIYAFCNLYQNDKILIVSSDGDFKQIPFRHRSIDLYNPNKKNEIVPVEESDPIPIKCFMGEDTDNIDGYFKVGPVTAKRLVMDEILRNEFFQKHGNEKYDRNKKLIDLSIAPYLSENIEYIKNVMESPVTFDIKQIYSTIQKYKVKGLSGEINNCLLPLKFIS